MVYPLLDACGVSGQVQPSQQFDARRSRWALLLVALASNPGAFHWTPPLKINPAQPHFTGKVIILVDEVSQSQAEYTTMALRTAPGAKVVGSTTAGADGNVSQIPLPGALSSMISGIGVFYPESAPPSASASWPMSK